jgi:hypothetical protein
MNIDDPFDLLGLFQGIGLPLRAQSAPTHMTSNFGGWSIRKALERGTHRPQHRSINKSANTVHKHNQLSWTTIGTLPQGFMVIPTTIYKI